RPRRRRLVPAVPWPLQLDASAGRGHERPGSGSVAKSGKGGTARGATPPGGGGPRHHRLGEDLHRREGRRGQELLCRAKLGTHAAERRVSQDPEGLIAAGFWGASA